MIRLFMKKYYILFIVVAASLCSCQKEYENDSVTSFKTEAFKDFLWKKQPPVSITAVINTSFEECEGIEEPLILQLCDDDANPIGTDIAQLYVSGVKSSDNTIRIDPNSGIKETEITIVLDDSQIEETRTFSWNLQVVDNPGIMKINDRAPEKDPWIVDTEVFWKNKHVANPVKVGVDISGSTILICLVVWILLAQFVLFPKFKQTQANKIFVMIDGGRRNILGYNSSAIGSKEIVLTPAAKKQSIISRLFSGKVTYVQVRNLPEKIVLTPGSGRYQAKASYNRKIYDTSTSGDNNELRIIKSTDESKDIAVEYYANSR